MPAGPRRVPEARALGQRGDADRGGEESSIGPTDTSGSRATQAPAARRDAAPHTSATRADPRLVGASATAATAIPAMMNLITMLYC